MSTTIAAHSERHHSHGVFLILFGVAVGLLVPPVLELGNRVGGMYEFVPHLGLLSTLVGFWLMRTTKKRYIVEPGSLTVREGLFSRPTVYRWKENPSVRLALQDDDNWVVSLVCGKPHYVLDRRAGHPMESRSLAEELARALTAPLIEIANGSQIVVSAEELSLSFTERAKRHPQLLGPEIPAPEGREVEVVEEPGRLRFDWWPTPQETIPLTLGLIGLAVLFSYSGLFAEHRTAFDLAREFGDYRFFILSGFFVIGLSGAFMGYHRELEVSGDEVSTRTLWFGLTLDHSRIPLSELKEVWVVHGQGGSGYLELISDHKMLGGRVSQLAVARWVASKVRRFVGGAQVPEKRAAMFTAGTWVPAARET